MPDSEPKEVVVKADVVDEVAPTDGVEPTDDDLTGVYAEVLLECTPEPSDSVMVVYLDHDVLAGFAPEYPQDCVVISPGPAVVLQFKTIDQAFEYCNGLPETGVAGIVILRGSPVPFTSRKFNVFSAKGVTKMLPV